MIAALSSAGWVFMLSSVIAVTTLVVWCFIRVLRLPPDEPPAEPPAGLGP